MEYYKYVGVGNGGALVFPSSVWLSLLTETEMCALFRSSTQIIADTALLMNKRDWVVDVESSRFDEVMAACISEKIFTNDRVAEFKRGIIPISEMEYRYGSI